MDRIIYIINCIHALSLQMLDVVVVIIMQLQFMVDVATTIRYIDGSFLVKGHYIFIELIIVTGYSIFLFVQLN